MFKKENAIQLVEEYNENQKALKIEKAEKWLNDISVVIESCARRGEIETPYILIPKEVDGTVVREILIDNGYNYDIRNGFMKIIWDTKRS